MSYLNALWQGKSSIIAKPHIGERSRLFKVVFVFIALLLFSQIASSSQTLQPNPDSIPFFGPVTIDSVGRTPTSVFCADLDNDQDLDIVVVNHQDANLVILWNDGYGTFSSRDSIKHVGPGPWFVFCADLNRDSLLDMVVTNYSQDSVSVLLNEGGGLFADPVSYLVGDYPYSVFCADLNNDSNLDLAVANRGTNNVSILMNNGYGTFAGKVDILVGPEPYTVFCADLNGDGKNDLAVAEHGNPSLFKGRVSVLLNNGYGEFPTKVDYDTGNGTMSVFCADLDNDGRLDMAIANQHVNNVFVRKNKGNGVFDSVAVSYTVGDNPWTIFCADLDGDSFKDIAVTNYDGDLGSVSILRNDGHGTFRNAVNYSVGARLIPIYCADLDNDVDLDIVVASETGNSVSILFNLSNKARPDSFSLISPFDMDFLRTTDTLYWQKAIDPDPTDTVRYDLYLSHFPDFYPDLVVYDSLVDTAFIETIGPGIWYWKVKAYDEWGAQRWSNQTWSFCVCSNPDSFFLISPQNEDTVKYPATLTWQKSVKQYPSDTVFYDLYLSRYPGFNPSIVYTDLLDTTKADSSGLGFWYWKVKAHNRCSLETWSDTLSFYVYLCGDCNADGVVDVGDVVWVINYLFKSGPPPKPYAAGDCNGDEVIDVGDAVYLINYLFKGGKPPCEP